MKEKSIIFTIWLTLCSVASSAQITDITNAYGRQVQSLNGDWNVLCDPNERGVVKHFYQLPEPLEDHRFYEYSFDGTRTLQVPGDWNSQSAEFLFYEGTMWYQRNFSARKVPGERKFLYFDGVSNRCTVYLNGMEVGRHEGAFTSFWIEITEQVQDGDNYLVLWVNNQRRQDAIPAMSFDWWNYGGITRDVLLVSLPQTFIRNYHLYQDRQEENLIHVSVQLSAPKAEEICLSVNGLLENKIIRTDDSGHGRIQSQTHPSLVPGRPVPVFRLAGNGYG